MIIKKIFLVDYESNCQEFVHPEWMGAPPVAVDRWGWAHPPGEPFKEYAVLIFRSPDSKLTNEAELPAGGNVKKFTPGGMDLRLITALTTSLQAAECALMAAAEQLLHLPGRYQRVKDHNSHFDRMQFADVGEIDVVVVCGGDMNYEEMLARLRTYGGFRRVSMMDGGMPDNRLQRILLDECPAINDYVDDNEEYVCRVVDGEHPKEHHACYICPNLWFHSERDKDRHMQRFHPLCPMGCDKRFDSAEALSEHMEQVKFKCEVCGDSHCLWTAEHLAKHVALHNINSFKSTVMVMHYKCKFCDNGNPFDYISMAKHLRSCRKRAVICKECTTISDNRAQHNKHFIAAHPLKCFKCSICAKKLFVEEKDLEAHRTSNKHK